MTPEEIKIGETYYVRVKVDSKDSRGVDCRLVDADGKGVTALAFFNWLLYAFLPVPSSPKYDPCRLFKKGDIVTPIKRDGREVPDGAPVGEKCTVLEPEKNGIVRIHYVAGSVHFIYALPFYYLELVTPVEELEPYRVEESSDYYSVDKGIKEICVYWKDCHPNPKAAAEAERDRLNAEHRKEQSNGNQ